MVSRIKSWCVKSWSWFRGWGSARSLSRPPRWWVDGVLTSAAPRHPRPGPPPGCPRASSWWGSSSASDRFPQNCAELLKQESHISFESVHPVQWNSMTSVSLWKISSYWLNSKMLSSSVSYIGILNKQFIKYKMNVYKSAILSRYCCVKLYCLHFTLLP